MYVLVSAIKMLSWWNENIEYVSQTVNILMEMYVRRRLDQRLCETGSFNARNNNVG